jgi:hypothetical protein
MAEKMVFHGKPNRAAAKKATARKSCVSCGRLGGKRLLSPLAGFRGLGGLGGLGLDHALLEFVHAAGRIHEFLRAGVEGVAQVAYTQHHVRLGGAGFDDVAAGATNFRVHIFRMNVSSHKSKVVKIAAFAPSSSPIFINFRFQ